jgi:DNA-binding XRE family transcriptional regulator
MKALKEAKNDELNIPPSTYLRPFTWLRRIIIGRVIVSLSLTYLHEEERGIRLYNRLSALCAERGLSHQQLAEVLDISPSTVLCIERGEYNPGLELSLRISQFFGIPVEEIFSYEPL